MGQNETNETVLKPLFRVSLLAVVAIMWSNNFMDLDQAIQLINTQLKEINPKTFSSSWIYRQTPKAYRYIWVNIRTELGDIDWDKVTSKVDREYQARWVYRRAKRVKTYRNIWEVRLVLKSFQEKLYVFIAPATDDDRIIRNAISIALVRLAQKGNLRAQQELVKLLKYTVEMWVEFCPVLWIWKGYSDDMEDKIKGCIRCYRFTGTFTGYLFKTLQYAGRGLRRLNVYSLDDTMYDSQKRIIDNVVQDQQTQQITIYDRTNHTF